MNDTFVFLSSSMSNKHQRIREIKYHINQLLSELRLMEPNNSSLETFSPFNITINSSLTTISNEKDCLLDNQCPYLTRKQTILHSTTYQEYKKRQQRKKHVLLTPKKKFVALACATSTPKNSPNENLLLQQHHLTSTPRRNKRPSTNFIPLKRLLYNKDTNRQRHSTKRYNSLHPIDEHHPQWI